MSSEEITRRDFNSFFVRTAAVATVVGVIGAGCEPGVNEQAAQVNIEDYLFGYEPSPQVDNTNLDIASYDDVMRELANCQFTAPEGRVGGTLDYTIDPNIQGGGESTSGLWADRRTGAPHAFYIDGMELVNIPLQDLYLVCDFVNKAIGHVYAADWLVGELENTTGKIFEEVRDLDGGDAAITGMTDFLAMYYTSPEFQKTIMNVEFGELKLSKHNLARAHALTGVGKIVDPRVDWWIANGIWDLLPDR